ncbi:MAG: hypothetical protein WBG86_06525 [Polyangiales bacterium]
MIREERAVDDLSVDETAVVVTEVRAIDEQVARGAAPIERLIGSDDEEVHVRVVSRASFGDRASDDQPQEARVVTVRVSQAVDGSLVVGSDRHAWSIIDQRLTLTMHSHLLCGKNIHGSLALLTGPSGGLDTMVCDSRYGQGL